MSSHTKVIFCLFILSFVCANFIQGLCWKRPLDRDDNISKPKRKGLLSMRTFNEKIAGSRLWYSFMVGIAAARGTDAAFRYSEIEIEQTDPNAFAFNVQRVVVNSTCLYNISFPLLARPRARLAEFDADGGDYLSFYSSDPDRYVWLYACFDGPKGTACPPYETFVELLVRANTVSPFDIDLQQVTNDLYDFTCFITKGIPGLYNFVFTQGVNTCPGPDNNGNA